MGKAMGERGETGRDCRAGVWQGLVREQAGEGQQVPGAGQEVGTGQTQTECQECVHAFLCLCLSLSQALVCSLCKRGSQIAPKKEGLVPRAEDWANGRESGPGTGRGGGSGTVREELAIESKGDSARQVTTSSSQSVDDTPGTISTRPWDAEPRGEPRPSSVARSCLLRPGRLLLVLSLL